MVWQFFSELPSNLSLLISEVTQPLEVEMQSKYLPLDSQPSLPSLTLKQTRMSHAGGEKISGHHLGSKAAQPLKIKGAAGQEMNSSDSQKLFGSVPGDEILRQE